MKHGLMRMVDGSSGAGGGRAVLIRDPLITIFFTNPGPLDPSFTVKFTENCKNSHS